MKPRSMLTVAVAFLLTSSTLYAKTGVVFIHGKGGANLAQQSVARAYWGEDMIRATTKGFTIPSTCVSSDWTRWAWPAEQRWK